MLCMDVKRASCNLRKVFLCMHFLCEEGIYLQETLCTLVCVCVCVCRCACVVLGPIDFKWSLGSYTSYTSLSQNRPQGKGKTHSDNWKTTASAFSCSTSKCNVYCGFYNEHDHATENFKQPMSIQERLKKL